MVDMAAQTKTIDRIPVMAVGRLEIPALTESLVRDGEADIGRGLLADPYWPQKVRSGRIEGIRPCVGCHECIYRQS